MFYLELPYRVNQFHAALKIVTMMCQLSETGNTMVSYKKKNKEYPYEKNTKKSKI